MMKSMLKPFKTTTFVLTLLALTLPVLLQGCSSAAMKTTPIWDREYSKAVGPVEDRINVWPIFYYRNPAWSLFWPLVSVTDEGSAFVPLYEYDKVRDELRLLYVHQALPAVGIFSGADRYARVLNVIRDRKRDTFYILPLYFQDFRDSSLLVLPILYKDKETFWSPLYMQSEKLTGVLGPLFNVYHPGKDTTIYNFPFPLAGIKSGPRQSGFWMLPLVNYDRDEKATEFNLGVLLFNFKRSGGSREIYYAALLGGARRRANGDGSNYLVPLWFYEKKGDKTNFISLPYTQYRDKDYSLTNLLLNGWIEVRKGDDLYQSLFWPVFQRSEKAGRRGHTLLPLYKTSTDKDGHRSIYSLPFNYESDGRLFNVLGPLYFRKQDGPRRYTAVAWPLGHTWQAPESQGVSLLPLFYASRKPDGGRTLITPLGGLARGKDSETLDIAGPFYFHKRDQDGKYLTVCWPLAHAWDKGGRKGSALLPLYFAERAPDGGRTLLTPLGLRIKSQDKEIVDIGGPLFFSARDRNGKSTAFLWPLFNTWQKRGEKGLALLPFYYDKRTPDGGRVLVTPLGGMAKTLDEEILSLGGPLWITRRNMRTGDRYRAVGWPLWQEWWKPSRTKKLLLPVFYWMRGEDDFSFYSLPLSFGGGPSRRFLNVGALLFHRAVKIDRSSGFLLANVIGWERSRLQGYAEAHVFPLFAYKDTPERRSTSLLLSGASHAKLDEATLRRRMIDNARNKKQYYGHGEQLNERHALGFIYRNRERLVGHMAPLKPGETLKENETAIGGAGGAAKKFTVRKERESWLLPLYHAKATEGEGAQANLLWRLYDMDARVHADGTTDVRQRVLWRLFHREAQGPKTSIDIFPFITWDRNEAEGTSSFKFAGGLLGGGTKDGKGYTRVLFMKF